MGIPLQLPPCLAYAMLLPASPTARRTLTQQHLSRSSGAWPRRRSYRPLADPSQAQSAPAPRALAFCFCSSGLPAWRVVSLCPRTPGKSSKKTLLGPSWTTSGVKQGIHQSAHSASLQPQLLAKWSLLALHQRPVSRCVPKFPRSLPSLALASLSCAKAYTNYMPKYTPIFKRFPP